MAKNPLLLNMIVSFHRFSAGKQLPKRRSDLYADICQMQLWDRPREKYVEMLLRESESKRVLQRVALRMSSRAEPTVKLPISELTQLADRYISELSDREVSAKHFVDQVQKVSELLVERDIGEYEFSHQCFQDYLTACEIVENHSVDFMIEKLESKWWRETILLYAEMANPVGLIEAAVEMGTSATVDIAYRCLQAGDNLRKVSPVLQAKLRGKRYNKLEDLLKAGKWKEANNETYELMISAVAKESGQYFTPEDLNAFPRKELLQIDELWVKYSQGHFGFTVQKKIWMSLGGRTDDHYGITWEIISTACGWKEPIFSMKAKKGGLPCVGRVIVMKGMYQDIVGTSGWASAFLLSHPDL